MPWFVYISKQNVVNDFHSIVNAVVDVKDRNSWTMKNQCVIRVCEDNITDTTDPGLQQHRGCIISIAITHYNIPSSHAIPESIEENVQASFPPHGLQDFAAIITGRLIRNMKYISYSDKITDESPWNFWDDSDLDD